MLLFIDDSYRTEVLTPVVSIHLMLLFIHYRPWSFSRLQSFQYISCCYLSEHRKNSACSVGKFQYISCCYLSQWWQRKTRNSKRVSIHLMLLFIAPKNLREVYVSKFQYISCCYLSFYDRNRKYFIFKFQYISCCYLSSSPTSTEFALACFNTSHVVIYPIGYPLQRVYQVCFNTSHVVIYLWLQNKTCFFIGVSIHLMLLFIGKSKIKKHGNYAFQYISCCYLSNFLFVISAHKTVSIHLMLLFIVWIW